MTLNPPRRDDFSTRLRRTTVTVYELAYAAGGLIVGVLLGILVS